MFGRSYLEFVVEEQGKLFELFEDKNKGCSSNDFIISYMKSATKKYQEDGQAYILTMSAKELYDYFIETDKYKPKSGERIGGFQILYLGQFYAYYSWFYNIASSLLVDKLTVSFLLEAYNAIHDLDLQAAVEKVGKV